jgi:hypothetical protein
LQARIVQLLAQQHGPVLGHRRLSVLDAQQGPSFSFETELEPMLVFSVTAEYLRQAWGNLTTSKRLHFVKLPDTLKPQIVALLKSNGDGNPLRNGKASSQRNVVSRQLSWTLQNETQAESMLIWHIATDYLPHNRIA